MDIANLVDYEVTHRLELKHPITEVGLGIYFDVVSVNAKEPRKVQVRNQAKLMALNIAQGRKKDKTESEMASLIEKQTERTIELLAACIKSWDWGKNKFDGVANLELTPENAAKVLAKDWIFDQVDAAVADIENFIKG